MAIAFDAATDGGSDTNTSLTYSHTTSGSDRVLLVGVVGATGASDDFITGVTYNSVSMSLVDKVAANGNRWEYLFLLVNPASGANNVVVSASTSDFLASQAASYTGCAQSGQPNADNTGQNFSTSFLPIAATSSVADCWFVMHANGFTGSPMQAGTDTTRRVGGAAPFGLHAIGDSNGPLSAGSHTLELGYPSEFPPTLSGVIAALAPAGGGGGGGQPMRTRFGAVPHVGGGAPMGRSGFGRMWGRTRSGLSVPRRLAA